MQTLTHLPCPAKLNLFLHVLGRRDDGYHLLQSAFVLIDWQDTLHLELRRDGRLCRHDLTEQLPPDDLCLKAARALQAASGTSLGADISIEKSVPWGAGMGGGSSDAASTLLGLNRLWGLNWPRARLTKLALGLGADVPFFVGGRNAWVEGIGEQLEPIELPRQRFAVVKPPTALATASIFSSPLLARNTSPATVAGFLGHAANELCGETIGLGQPGPVRVASEAKNPALIDLFGGYIGEGFGRNDLQPPAEALCDEVTAACDWLRARFGNARMTGSGSAVFAKLDALNHADRASREERLMAQDAAFQVALRELGANWVGRLCESLEVHPLRNWAPD
jgi:4-diphosphocytidyl-2-C-methyl-D-erythritol kinase